MMFRKAGLVLAATMIVAAGASRADAPLLPDFTSFVLVRTGDAPAPMSVEAVADALKDYDVVVIGELHDHIANHLAEMALLRALQARHPDMALSMEQFERDTQPVLDDYLAGRIGEETLKSRGRAWRNYAEAYRPLVEYAKAHGLAVIAANAPEALVHCVGEKGPNYLAILPPEKRGQVAAQLHTEDGDYKKNFMKFLGDNAAHGGGNTPAGKARGERAFAAQVLRDDTMAESIMRYLAGHPGAKVLHVTGAFHADARLGTVERIAMRAPGASIALVMPVEADHLNAAAIGEDARAADFALLITSEPTAFVSDAERKAMEDRQVAQFRAAAKTSCKP